MTNNKNKANTGNTNAEEKILPHDSLFKRIMENDIAAKEFLSEYLPQEVKDIIDLNTIKVQKESYIEPNLTKRLSDIVYKVDAKNNQEAFIYIACEHQSSVDQLMAFRLWKYTLLLAERHLDKKGNIPLIFPLVVYAGKAKYTAPRTQAKLNTQLLEIYGHYLNIQNLLKSYLPKIMHWLIYRQCRTMKLSEKSI